MSTLNLSTMNERLEAMKASYRRQLGLAGKPGYDPQLTIQLKKDMDWLLEQKLRFIQGLNQTGEN